MDLLVRVSLFKLLLGDESVFSSWVFPDAYIWKSASKRQKQKRAIQVPIAHVTIFNLRSYSILNLIDIS